MPAPSFRLVVSLFAAVGLCACSFDTRFGGARVTCTGDSDCPDPATFCAQVDPSDPTHFCIARDSVGAVTITGVTVSREDGTAATRFSRQPGFDRGQLSVTLDGTAQTVTALVAGALVTCSPPASGAQAWQCPFAVGADTTEGSELARVTASDALGRAVSERAPLTFDFTAPAVVAATITTRLAPPSQSPLALLGPQWAPTALATGSSLQVTFGLDEASATPARVWLEPGVDLPAPQRSGTVWLAELVVPAGIADGTLALEATATDDVGNVSAPQPLAMLTKDDTPPPAPLVANAASRVERRPFAATRAGAFLALDHAVEPGAVVLASLPTSNFAVGIVRADATGSAASSQLAVADAAALALTAVDAAGNASPTVAVRRFVLHATPAAGTIPNPSTLERRPQFVPALIVTRTLSSTGSAMQSDDGVFATVNALATWRRESFDTLNFTCGAAVSDTARASMTIAGAWPAACADNNASVVFFNGAGGRRINPPFVTTQRGVPVYDSLRSQVMVLPLVGGGGPPVFDTSFVGRVGGTPAAAPVSAGAYDPRRDDILGLTPQGLVFVYDRTFGWLDGGSVPRLNGQLAWSASHDAVVLAGGLELDGGVSTELLAWNGDAFSRVADAPPIADALMSWDPNVHALRLIARGTPNTWLFADGGFVAQAPAPVNIDWWAPWPGRQGDTWLNPGKKADGTYGLVLRDGGVRPADYVMPPQARSGMQALPLAERGDVLIGGGTDGLYAYPGHYFYEADFGWHFAADLPTLGLGVYVRAADGGVLALGGVTLPDAGATTSVANTEVFRLDVPSQRFSPLGVTVPRPAAPTAAWLLPDGTVYTHGPTPQQVPLNPSRLFLDQGVLVELDAGTTPRFRSTCAVSLENGTALAIGGDRYAPFTGCTTGVCPSNETLRLTDAGWVIDTIYRLPTARAGHGCSFDSARQALYVSQGVGQNGQLLEHVLDGGNGWHGIGEYAPDGVPDVRDRAVMVFDRATSTHLLIGGRDPTTQDNFNELWRLEVATARPGITWRLPLDSLLVPLRSTELRLRVRARAGASGQASDHVTPLDGVELLLWHDGVWEPLGSAGGSATAPADLQAELTRLDTTYFERHSVSVAVRAFGERGAGEATAAADSFEWELEYELPP
ncbi:MAG: hypothetical protein U0228_38970 [Myxococcaceae bacterium]